jgi:hypothetical protein
MKDLTNLKKRCKVLMHYKKREVITMEKNVKISMLNEIYGKLLTQKQNEILDDYYNQDLSLSEIAENNQITRQAVRDILQKAEKKLNEYEQKLMLLKKEEEKEKKIKKILAELTNQKEKCNSETKKILEKIEKNLRDLE